MPTTLDQLTWFAESAWGIGITGVLVPIAAATSAAWAVIIQVRKSDRLRVADRRVEAGAVLTRMFVDTVAPVFSDPPASSLQVELLRSRANEHLARAAGLLEGGDRRVISWCAVEILNVGQQVSEYVPLQAARGRKSRSTLLAKRSDVTGQVAGCLQVLVSWQNEEIPTLWFEENLGVIGSPAHIHFPQERT